MAVVIQCGAFRTRATLSKIVTIDTVTGDVWGCFGEFKLLFISAFSHCSIVCNIMLYKIAIRHETGVVYCQWSCFLQPQSLEQWCFNALRLWCWDIWGLGMGLWPEGGLYTDLEILTHGSLKRNCSLMVSLHRIILPVLVKYLTFIHILAFTYEYV